MRSDSCLMVNYLNLFLRRFMLKPFCMSFYVIVLCLVWKYSGCVHILAILINCAVYMLIAHFSLMLDDVCGYELIVNGNSSLLS